MKVKRGVLGLGGSWRFGAQRGVIQRLQHRILAEWLPSSGYEWAPKADIEVYFGPRMTAEDYRSQVWLPIEKRAE